MPHPKSVIIEDDEIPEVEDVTIRVVTPTDETGLWSGKTEPVKVTLKRRARNCPTSDFFWYAADSEDSAFLKGTIVFQNVAEKTTYTMELKKALIDNYTFEQPEADGDLEETIELTVWDFELSAEGKGKKSFKVTPSGEHEQSTSGNG